MDSSSVLVSPRPRVSVSIFFLACRYLLAAVFLMAALTKLTDLNHFENQLVYHSQLPFKVAMTVAYALPWLELTCGLCLAFGYAVREAALITGLLLILFTIHTVVYGSEDDCQCFFFPTPMQSVDWWKGLGNWSYAARNLILFLCSVWVAWRK